MELADCPLTGGCPFFNDRMQSMPAMSNLFKNNYCLTDNTHCGRYMIASTLGREFVPSDLFPNQQERAREIIKAKSA